MPEVVPRQFRISGEFNPDDETSLDELKSIEPRTFEVWNNPISLSDPMGIFLTDPKTQITPLHKSILSFGQCFQGCGRGQLPPANQKADGQNRNFRKYAASPGYHGEHKPAFWPLPFWAIFIIWQSRTVAIPDPRFVSRTTKATSARFSLSRKNNVLLHGFPVSAPGVR